MPKGWKRIAGCSLMLGTALWGCWFLFEQGFLRFNYPSKEEFPVRGMDVSHHQKDIDWPRLKEEGLTFVFIKATEGANFQDPKFTENWQGAGKAGLVRGAYHFFTFCRSGGEQAKNFIATVPKEPGILPPTVDVEFGGNCKKVPDPARLTAELKIFIEEIRRHYAKTPVIYATREAYEAYFQNELTDIPLWIRDIFRRPSDRETRRWTFWQYSNRGRLNGVSTPVDLNVFQGTAEEFFTFLSSGDSPKPGI